MVIRVTDKKFIFVPMYIGDIYRNDQGKETYSMSPFKTGCDATLHAKNCAYRQGVRCPSAVT